MRVPGLSSGALLLALVGCGQSGAGPGQGAGSGSGSGAPTGSDASGTVATASSTTRGPDLGPLQLAFEEVDVEGGLWLSTDLAFLPGSDEFFVLSRDGAVGHYRLGDGRADALGTFTIGEVYVELDCGLISVTFDPGFADNGFFYVSACTSGTHSAVFRLRFDPSNYAGIADSQVAIVRAGDDDAPRPWHNVGGIGFDDSGALWALFGDKNVARNGQDATTDLGALLRVIPNREAGGEGSMPAPGNPVSRERSPNVYAHGLRSPWRGALDDAGRWWVGDVGANGFEEIDLISEPGQNFGWDLAEGPCVEDCAGLVEPVASWEHDTIVQYMVDDEDVRPAIARTAWVGLHYAPSAGDPYGGRLDNAVLFGDYCLGFVRAIEADASGDIVRDEHIGHLETPTGWARGPDGHIYATTFGRCETPNIDDGDPPVSRLWRAVAADG